jgi:hypothetical protein
MSHAQIARRLTIGMDQRVLAKAMADAVLHQDFLTLERMLPGMKFATMKVATSEWELIGTCEDGSTVTWGVGG